MQSVRRILWKQIYVPSPALCQVETYMQQALITPNMKFHLSHGCDKETKNASIKRNWTEKEIAFFKQRNWELKTLFGPVRKNKKAKKPTKKHKETVSLKKTDTLTKTPNVTSERTLSPTVIIKSSSDNLTSSAGEIISRQRENRVINESEEKELKLKNILSYPLTMNNASDSVPEVVLPSVRKYPSVSKILADTMSPESRYFLDKWEKEMIAELGYEGFQQMKKETFAKGHNLHACIEQHMSGVPEQEINILPSIEGHWQSLRGVFPDVSELVFAEASVNHPHLGYQGIFDCIAHYKGDLCLFEWKTSKKQKSKLEWTYDNPLQVAAYMGAVNADTTYTQQMKKGVLVIAYEDGTPAHVHPMNLGKCHHYWQAWLRRLHQYWTSYIADQGS